MKEIREALEFYARNWKTEQCPGEINPETGEYAAEEFRYPNGILMEDQGNIAREALSRLSECIIIRKSDLEGMIHPHDGSIAGIRARKVLIDKLEEALMSQIEISNEASNTKILEGRWDH